MRKWKWGILIGCIAVLTGWYFLFYKSYNRQAISANADMVLAIDVKRNFNSLLFYYISTPSAWKFGSIFRTRTKDSLTDWKAAVKLPDYLFIFHVKDQPAKAWYCRLEVKNKAAFERLMSAYNFKQGPEKNGQSFFYADELGIGIIKKEDQLLIGTIGANDASLLQAVMRDLFDKKNFMPVSVIEEIIRPANHFTLYVQKNNFLKEDLICNGNFSNGQLKIESLLRPADQYAFKEDSFDLATGSLLNLAIAHPSPEVYWLLPGTVKAKLSTAFGFNIDSLFTPDNRKYHLDIAGIKTRVDSAVSYVYDDDFNKVEKVVVNTVREPSFNFLVVGKRPELVVSYWIKNKNILKDESGKLFTPVPFVKTYVTIAQTDSLTVRSANYTISPNLHRISCIGYLDIRMSLLPTNAGAYLPDKIEKCINKLDDLKLLVSQKQGLVKINLTLTARNKKSPFLLSFN